MQKPPISSKLRLLLLLAAACPVSAANPYLHLDSGDAVVSRWSGSEWGDEIGCRTKGEDRFRQR